MKVKVCDATPVQLGWMVAKCEGVINGDDLDIGFILEKGYSPPTNWAQAGPIIEREEISISREFASSRVEWAAWTPAPIRDDAEAFGYGPTPLIAAMRCYVASKLGDEVEIPGELA